MIKISSKVVVMDHRHIDVFIESERLRMRPFREDDEALLLEIDSDPEVMKYLTYGRPSTPEEGKVYIKRIMTVQKRHRDRLGYWVAYEKESGQPIGWFHFRPCKQDIYNTDRIELGYRLMRRFWGKGYATEGSRALIEYGREVLGTKEVFAQTLVENSGSQKVMKKLGMIFEKQVSFDSLQHGIDAEGVVYRMKL
jgi:RimJ/RimL family protein N-acetyltransferase